MERLHRAVAWVRAAVVGGIALSAELIVHQLRQRFGSNVAASVALLLIATLAFKVAEVLAEVAINHSVTLRRIILGSHFVEGYWVNTVQDPGTDGRVDSVGIMNITFREGRYEASGRSLALNGSNLGNFTHSMSRYDDYTLKFAFEGANSRARNGHVEGYGEYKFTADKPVPRSYDGFVQDTFYPTRMTVHGVKVLDRRQLRSIHEHATELTLITDVVASVAPGVPIKS